MEPTDFVNATIKQRKLKPYPIDKLVPYARNANKHSEYQIGLIAKSMSRYGWTNPVLIDEHGGIVAGHGRVLAAKQLGLKTVPTITMDGLDPADVRAYVLADNQLANLAQWDHEMLATELSELKQLDVELETLGFDDKFITKLLEPVNPGGFGIGGGTTMEPEHVIVVVCANEQQQSELFEELSGRGLECKIML